MCCVKSTNLKLTGNPATSFTKGRNIYGQTVYSLVVTFSLTIEFSDEGLCRCECCEYRQGTKGSHSEGGKKIPHTIDYKIKYDKDGNPVTENGEIQIEGKKELKEDEYQEDSNPAVYVEDGKIVVKVGRYGHRNDTSHGIQAYSADGCTYTMTDSPGVETTKAPSNPAVKYEFKLGFWMGVADVCRGGMAGFAAPKGDVSDANGAAIPLPHEFEVTGSANH